MVSHMLSSKKKKKDFIQTMVSHRLSSIQKKSYKTLYRRWFHICCQVYRYNLIRLYTEDGFT